jgi:hypothetical protein
VRATASSTVLQKPLEEAMEGKSLADFNNRTIHLRHKLKKHTQPREKLSMFPQMTMCSWNLSSFLSSFGTSL